LYLHITVLYINRDIPVSKVTGNGLQNRDSISDRGLQIQSDPKVKYPMDIGGGPPFQYESYQSHPSWIF